jgi:hypothetical protein
MEQHESGKPPQDGYCFTCFSCRQFAAGDPVVPVGQTSLQDLVAADRELPNIRRNPSFQMI